LTHVFYNIGYFVLLTVFVYSPDLLVEFPHPIEIALIVLFLVPSLFPPYTWSFLVYLTIDIIFLVAFIFRAIAFEHFPYISIDVITFLLNSRTLLSFLPLLQMLNIIGLAFPLPRLKIIQHLLYPLVPIAISLFIAFFLTIYLLSDTHNSVQETFDILLRTILLDIHPLPSVQFHPVAARIAFYLFSISAIYLFWGVGIAGIGMKTIKETDWHVERVREKAVRLLRYLPRRQGTIKRRRLLGSGRVMSSMPFSILEGLAIIFRLPLFRAFIVRLWMLPVVLVWSLGYAVLNTGLHIWGWIGNMAAKVVDEMEGDELDMEVEVDSDEDVNESTRLLS
jgi:hypothetical protein